jgi:peptide/nickel transport system permease protein
VILYLLPSNPVELRLAGGDNPAQDVSPVQLAALKHQYGLDKPLWQRYADLLWNALHLHFGTSSMLNEPVSTVLADRLPNTVTLAGFSVVLMLIFGVGLAYLAAYVQWRPAKAVLTRLPAIGVSAPTFWVGLLLIQVFSFWLGWFPSTGAHDLRSFVLPGITMALPSAAILAQVLTRSLERTLAEPYITTAKAKGLTHGVIQWRHALKNAALPTLTMLGLLVGLAVTNAVIAETVFSISGIGRLAQQAVAAQDVPVVQAVVLIASALFVVVNLAVDLLYPLLDPRITYTPSVI